MTAPRAALWAAGTACFTGGVFLLAHAITAPGCLLLLACTLILTRAEQRELRRRQRHAYQQQYGSSREAMRRTIGAEVLHRARAEKGDLHAIRLARRHLPNVPLKEITTMIRETQPPPT